MSRDEKVRKVSLFIGSLTGGGAERVTCNLANYLQENGCSVDVITMSDVSDTYKLNKGINRFYLLRKKERSNKIQDFIVRQKRLKQYVINNQDVDCYIVMLPITIFMLVRLRKFTNGKIIISDRCNPTSYNFIKKIMMKYSARRCDGLVVQTEEISRWYRGVKNKIIIPNAINKDIVFPKREKNEKRIVAVGRIEGQKNYPMLVKSFAIFSKEHPDYRLEIYGKGSQEESIRKLIEKYQLTGKIKLMGYVKNISERIANATCFVMTSNFEGMPNALIEAMCIGIPCIATDCDGGGARELMHNKKNGFLIDKNDVDGLVRSLNKIITDDGFANNISAESIKLRDKLSYEKIYNMWSGFIMRTIKEDDRYE